MNHFSFDFFFPVIGKYLVTFWCAMQSIVHILPYVNLQHEQYFTYYFTLLLGVQNKDYFSDSEAAEL